MNDDIIERLAIAAQYLRAREQTLRKITPVDADVWARLIEDAAREITELRKRPTIAGPASGPYW